jgi:hypothetical protein
MDDFVLTNLYESRNEWCCRLINIFTPLIIEGLQSIFNESWNLCIENGEVSKYLMTFQNLLSRIPKWNSIIVEEERNRIIERSGCKYLEDLITCVHIIQLKVLTSIRVGNKQKKIDITIPKLDIFIHKVYIAAARKIYSNVYLYEKNITPLAIQKNNRELEKIVQECILKTVQESIPTAEIIRAYLDNSVETEEEVIIEDMDTPVAKKSESVADAINDESSSSSQPKEESPPEIIPTIKDVDNEPVHTRLTFNEMDTVLDEKNIIKQIPAPKLVENLERKSVENYLNNEYESNTDDYGNDRIKIFEDDNVSLEGIDNLDSDLAANSVSLDEGPLFDFEELN